MTQIQLTSQSWSRLCIHPDNNAPLRAWASSFRTLPQPGASVSIGSAEQRAGDWISVLRMGQRTEQSAIVDRLILGVELAVNGCIIGSMLHLHKWVRMLLFPFNSCTSGYVFLPSSSFDFWLSKHCPWKSVEMLAFLSVNPLVRYNSQWFLLPSSTSLGKVSMYLPLCWESFCWHLYFKRRVIFI